MEFRQTLVATAGSANKRGRLRHTIFGLNKIFIDWMSVSTLATVVTFKCVEFRSPINKSEWSRP